MVLHPRALICVTVAVLHATLSMALIVHPLTCTPASKSSLLQASCPLTPTSSFYIWASKLIRYTYVIQCYNFGDTKISAVCAALAEQSFTLVGFAIVVVRSAAPLPSAPHPVSVILQLLTACTNLHFKIRGILNLPQVLHNAMQCNHKPKCQNAHCLASRCIELCTCEA